MSRVIIIVLLGFVLAACGGPTLMVRHQDPTHPLVDIRVDDENVGAIEYGETLSMRVEEGVHQVDASPRGSDTNPWTEDGSGWRLFVQYEAQLTLLPAWEAE